MNFNEPLLGSVSTENPSSRVATANVVPIFNMAASFGCYDHLVAAKPKEVHEIRSAPQRWIPNLPSVHTIAP
jgi:hypothetical protein